MTDINTTNHDADLRAACEAYKTAFRCLRKASDMYTLVGRTLDRVYELATTEEELWTEKVDDAQLALTQRLYEVEQDCRRALHEAETALFEAYNADMLDIALAADGTVRYEDEKAKRVNNLIYALQHEVMLRAKGAIE